MKVLLSAVVVLVLMIGAPIVYAHSDAYKKGFAEGVKDGKPGIFHQGKLHISDDFSTGYIDGWASACKKEGFDTESCDLSMDSFGNPE